MLAIDLDVPLDAYEWANLDTDGQPLEGPREWHVPAALLNQGTRTLLTQEEVDRLVFPDHCRDLK